VLESLDSFIKRDADIAHKILLSDDAVDNHRNEITQELVSAMQADPEIIPRALDLIVIARNLERIADHATNVAEEVIFLVKGEVVRHMSELVSVPL